MEKERENIYWKRFFYETKLIFRKFIIIGRNATIVMCRFKFYLALSVDQNIYTGIYAIVYDISQAWLQKL